MLHILYQRTADSWPAWPTRYNIAYTSSPWTDTIWDRHQRSVLERCLASSLRTKWLKNGVHGPTPVVRLIEVSVKREATVYAQIAYIQQGDPALHIMHINWVHQINLIWRRVDQESMILLSAAKAVDRHYRDEDIGKYIYLPKLLDFHSCCFRWICNERLDDSQPSFEQVVWVNCAKFNGNL